MAKDTGTTRITFDIEPMGEDHEYGCHGCPKQATFVVRTSRNDWPTYACRPHLSDISGSLVAMTVRETETAAA